MIGNLNLVLKDMAALPLLHSILGGPPNHRFYLLLRTFFYEFYRLREILGWTLKNAAKRGLVRREEAKSARDRFNVAFSEVISLRNAMVHGRPTFKGKLHWDLTFLGMVHNLGGVFQKSDTGEVLKIDDALKSICAHHIEILSAEGNRVSSVLESIAHALYRACKQSKSESSSRA